MLQTETEEPGDPGSAATTEAPEPEPTCSETAPAPARPSFLAGYRLVIGLGLLAVLAGVLVAYTVFGSGRSTAAKPVDQLVFINPDGSHSTLADLRGQPLVVNFFASWCVPCKAEMPDIQAVYESAGGKVRILGIDGDIDEATWRSFVAQTSITYPTAFQADQSIFEGLKLTGWPSTIFISADGEVMGRYNGRITQQALRDQIKQHLGVDV